MTLAGADIEALSLRFSQVRSDTEALARPLSGEDQSIQSMPDTSPTKWHRAHVTWFFETFVLQPHEPEFSPFHPGYGYLFNSYYEQVGARFPRPQRGLVSRPGIDEIAAFRQAVDDRMLELIDGASPDQLAALGPLIELGLHHEQQHQELLLMDIKHVLSLNPLEPAYCGSEPPRSGEPGPAAWIDHEGGITEVGHAGPTFAFDNEGPRHQVLLAPYRLADRLVTCAEWLEFMADGGYRRPEFWLSDGWYTRQEEGWEAPLYWRPDGSTDEWRVHTLSGTRPVDPNEPACHVSFYEADAYARWAGHRLATEFEWEHATRSSPIEAPSGLHPRGAGAPTGELRQLYGDCWQWTESSYRPYPGFRPVAGAIGEYNGKFMINTMVLRGACAFTPRGHARHSYRNFFHPHTRWHLSGVRLASHV